MFYLTKLSAPYTFANILEEGHLYEVSRGSKQVAILKVSYVATTSLLLTHTMHALSSHHLLMLIELCIGGGLFFRGHKIIQRMK